MTNSRQPSTPSPKRGGFSYARLRAQQIAAAAAKRAEAQREPPPPLDWPAVREQLRRRREAEKRMPPIDLSG